jgi:predicted TIM-barrel fold metal-dependent hydrolase
MLGVRLTFLGLQAAWVTDGTADWFWPAAEKADLPVMVFAPGQTPEFARVADRHPRLSLIIDHMNLNAEIKKNNATASAIDQVVALAKYPNVSCKLSASPGHSFRALSVPGYDSSPAARL